MMPHDDGDAAKIICLCVGVLGFEVLGAGRLLNCKEQFVPMIASSASISTPWWIASHLAALLFPVTCEQRHSWQSLSVILVPDCMYQQSFSVADLLRGVLMTTHVLGTEPETFFSCAVCRICISNCWCRLASPYGDLAHPYRWTVHHSKWRSCHSGHSMIGNDHESGLSTKHPFTVTCCAFRIRGMDEMIDTAYPRATTTVCW